MLMSKSKFILIILFLSACQENESNRQTNEVQSYASKNERSLDEKICCLGSRFLKFGELFGTNNKLVISFKLGDITKFAKFNSDTNKWEKSAVPEKVLADEKITLVMGKTVVKNGDGVVLFEQPVPSIPDIESQTDIALPDAVAYYNYFKVGNDYRWDRKTIIINVGLNKKINNLTKGFSFAKFKSFLAEYDGINSLWTIRYLKELHTDRTYFTHDTPDVGIISTPHFINANTTCLGWNEFGFDFVIADKTFECIVRYDNGQLSLQKLYGEILPAEYADVLKQLHYQKSIIRLTSIRIFFDEKQNLYAFYTDEAKGKYFYFEMYKPDQPTVAQHKQKIYW